MFRQLFEMVGAYAGLTRLRTEEDGVTAIEYGLIAALVAVAIIIGAAALGGSLNGVFQFLSDKVGGATTTPSGG